MLIALGGAGTDAAIGMIVVQLLANGSSSSSSSRSPMGAALGIHPLAVLVVTIAGGALFGAVGLILARTADLGGRADHRRPVACAAEGRRARAGPPAPATAPG